jgi:hypothetical protein
MFRVLKPLLNDFSDKSNYFNLFIQHVGRPRAACDAGEQEDASSGLGLERIVRGRTLLARLIAGSQTVHTYRHTQRLFLSRERDPGAT